MKKILISRREASKMLGIDPRTFDSHIRPHLAEKRIGNKILFLRKDFDSLIESMFNIKKINIKKLLKELSL